MGWFSKSRPSSASVAVPTSGAADVIASPVAPAERKPAPANQCVELGKINYVNLEGSHGSTQAALEAARRTGRPMLVNFVEFPGWRGCKEAGRIFADDAVVRAAEELFTPVAFNTYDRYDSKRNEPMKRWATNLAGSWWGYLRVVSADGRTIVAGTRQLTGAGQLAEVKQVMRQALQQLNIAVPAYL